MKIFAKVVTALSIGGFVFFILLCTGLFFAENILKPNKYASVFFEEIEKETGYIIKCEDIVLKRKFAPELNLSLHHCVVLYPDEEIFLKLKDTDVSINVVSLFFKKLVFNEIKLSRPVINITMNKDFSTSLEQYSLLNKNINTRNFTFGGVTKGVTCENYKLKIKDKTINKEFYAEGNRLELNEVEKGKKIRVLTKGNLISDDVKYINYDLDVITEYARETGRFSFSPLKTIYEAQIKADVYSKIKTGKGNNLFGDVKIKNFSARINNKYIKNNNVNVNLKGEEMSFDALMHPSETDTVKLNGKVLYGNKKYIDVNATANNIRFENLLVPASYFTDILNIKNPLSEITVKGLISADFNVKSDFKKLKSSGSAKITDTYINHKSLPYSISDINADIDFKNNKLTVEKAFAIVNKTPIKLQGEINEDVSYKFNVVSSDLDAVNIIKLFNLDKNLPVNVTKGKLSLNADIKGILNKKYEADAKIETFNSGFIVKQTSIPVNINHSLISFKGTDKKYNGEITVDEINLKINKQNIKAESFRANFDERKITIPENKIISPAEFSYGGIINDYTKKEISGNFNYNGRMSSLLLSQILKSYYDIPDKPAGNIYTSGNINYKNETLSVKSRLKADANNYISFVVIKEILNKPSILEADFIADKTGVNIKDISLYKEIVNSKNRIINITGKIEAHGDTQLKNVRIKIPDFISGKTNFTGGEDFCVKGELTLNDKLNKPDVKGIINVGKYTIRKYEANIKNAEISFNGKKIKLNAPDIKLLNSDLSVMSDIVYDEKRITCENLKLKSNYINLTELYKAFNSFLPGAKGLENFRIKNASAAINAIMISGLKANNLSSDFTFENDIVKADNINGGAYGGRLSGSGEYNVLTHLIKAKLDTKGTDIRSSLYDLCGFEDNISGRADVNADISLYAGENPMPIKTLNGKAEFTAKNGTAGTLGKFEYYLSARNVVRNGFMNATFNKIINVLKKEDTAQFRDASGNVVLKDGFIISDGIKTSGSKMSLLVTGKHNMLSGLSNLTIYGRITDEIKQNASSSGDVTVSELFGGTRSEKEGLVMTISDEITSKIPLLYNKPAAKTNMFKVNLAGNIKSPSSIKNFTWIRSSGTTTETTNNNIVEESNIEDGQKENNGSEEEMGKPSEEDKTPEIKQCVSEIEKPVASPENDENVPKNQVFEEKNGEDEQSETLPDFSELKI